MASFSSALRHHLGRCSFLRAATRLWTSGPSQPAARAAPPPTRTAAPRAQGPPGAHRRREAMPWLRSVEWAALAAAHAGAPRGAPQSARPPPGRRRLAHLRRKKQQKYTPIGQRGSAPRQVRRQVGRGGRPVRPQMRLWRRCGARRHTRRCRGRPPSCTLARTRMLPLSVFQDSSAKQMPQDEPRLPVLVEG